MSQALHACAARRHVAAYFLLTFALSAPFWLWGAFGADIIPGLPISGLMAFTPAIAAVLAVRMDGDAGVALIGETLDVKRLRGKTAWIALNIALFPLLLALSYGAMMFAGAPLPEPHLSPVATVEMFAAFFVAGLSEEIGWSGYAFAPLERRHGALQAALVIGVIWTVWHLIPYMQTDRSPVWIAWHCLVTLATRVIAVWLFVNTGRSVLGAALFHAMCNVSYFSFPNGGSHYDAAYFAPFVVGAAAIAALAMRPALNSN